MLKRDTSGKLTYKVVGFFKRKRLWFFWCAKGYTKPVMGDEEYRQLLEIQKTTPVVVMTSGHKRWWLFQGGFYWDDENLSADDVKVLIMDREAQRRRRVQRAAARLTAGVELGAIRERIPDDVKQFVWERDKARCVRCNGQENLEYDHIVPVSKGGSNTARNIQLLCAECNRDKGGNIV